jgi:4-aminobutyrate--pyruvate transaminase
MNHLPNSSAARDIASLIHPATNLDSHTRTGPMVISRGEGVYVFDESGRRYLDGLAGLWSASLGYSEKRLVAAATRQMEQLPYCSLFGGRSHDPAIDLAETLLTMVPAGLDKVLFANSGSEANDQAVKLVWYYHNAIGRPRKKKIISRERAYHGVTLYAASLTGLPANHADFDLPLGGVLRTDCPSYYHYGRPEETEAEFVERIVGNLEQLIIRENPDTIGAFIAEPVQGAGGVIVPPAGYFEQVQTVLRRYGILFIADEVICGFGRTGSMFGCDTFAIQPDIMTVAKALSASYQPISATIVSNRIFEAMLQESRKLGFFGHGFTYAGHPVASAVALETLKLYQERDIVGMVRAVAPHFHERLNALASHPLVGQTRGIGLLGSIEVLKDKAAKTGFPPEDGMPAVVSEKILARGLINRLNRDSIALSPPLIISHSEIDALFDALQGGLDDSLPYAREKGLVEH